MCDQEGGIGDQLSGLGSVILVQSGIWVGERWGACSVEAARKNLDGS